MALDGEQCSAAQFEDLFADQGDQLISRAMRRFLTCPEIASIPATTLDL